MVLAHILRTDAHLHRALAADSAQAQAIEALARAHQDLVWNHQHEANRLRSLLAGYYPAALAAFGDLAGRTTMTVLAAAPTPARAARLTTADLLDLLASAGRGRRRSEAPRLAAVFAAPQMRQPAEVEAAMGDAAAAIITTITAMNTALTALAHRIDTHFEQHPDAAIYHSMPALGPILSARVPGRVRRRPHPLARSCQRHAYAQAHHPRIRQTARGAGPAHPQPRVYDASRWWAFAALSVSPAPAYYDRRPAGDGHQAVLRRLASKLVGQLHHRIPYNEAPPGPQPETAKPGITSPSLTQRDRGMSDGTSSCYAPAARWANSIASFTQQFLSSPR